LIYATDLNPAVLEKAAQGMFALSQMKQYSENYILSGGISDFSTYYTAKYSLAKFDPELSRKIIFSTHNLVSDHSFNEFQLILCRNVLIYFDRELQHQVIDLFDESLEELGYLALGTKETLEFAPVSKKYKRLPTEKIWRKLS
jgi:chemotaxis protein methyltransferase CheR